jgi:hypothetical protein
MAGTAMFLCPARECAANQRGNACQHHLRHPYAENPHVSNRRCYSRLRWLHRGAGPAKSRTLRKAGVGNAYGRGGLARGLFSRILHNIESGACSSSTRPTRATSRSSKRSSREEAP